MNSAGSELHSKRVGVATSLQTLGHGIQLKCCLAHTTERLERVISTLGECVAIAPQGAHLLAGMLNLGGVDARHFG
jgi:hypothetical protein